MANLGYLVVYVLGDYLPSVIVALHTVRKLDRDD